MAREKIFIQGYGFSGSSLIRDYLYEFDNIAHFNTNEFNLARASGGIYEIGCIIENQFNFVKDSVIRKFMQMINYEKNILCPVLGDEFLKLSNEFINKFIITTLETDYLDFVPNETLIMPNKKLRFSKHDLIDKFLNKHILKEYNRLFFDLVRTQNFNKNDFIVRNMPQKEYVELAKNYLENVISLIPENKRVVMVHPLNIISVKVDDSAQYWENYKVIIPHKDPRDIYCAMQNGKSPYLKAYKDNVEYFIEEFKDARKYHEHNRDFLGSKLMEISCEDFIDNYSEVSKKLNQFLNLDESNHINKTKLFKPENSRKFVGMYKDYKDQKAITKIEKELEGYIK